MHCLISRETYHGSGSPPECGRRQRSASETGYKFRDNEPFTGDEALLCALDKVFDGEAFFMMYGQSYRGRGLDTYSVEAVPQATKVKGGATQGSVAN